MRKAAAAALSVGAFMLVPAVAGAQNVRVVNGAGIPGWRVSQFKQAAGMVANGNLRAHWGSSGVTWNRSRGWPIVLVRDLATVKQVCGPGAAACHGVLNTGQPVAVVDANQHDTGVPWTVSASHELFEMLVDPYGQTQTAATDGSGDVWQDEVADPVEDYSHWVRGVRITDFVYPAWFQNAAGPQDAMNALTVDPGSGLFGFSCPTGYAQYWDPYLGEQKMGCLYSNGSGGMHTRAMRPRHDPDSHRLRGFRRGALKLNLRALRRVLEST
jgi:hypothetical protein